MDRKVRMGSNPIPGAIPAALTFALKVKTSPDDFADASGNVALAKIAYAWLEPNGKLNDYAF